ncbi:MAG: HAD family hydrolase [Acidobacteria bacterium]|nr:HAD family hydrolase [Acidobacteriota bacterium]
MTEARAVLFDLDDTLYPLERFAMSGFCAVAGVAEARWGVARATALETLVSATSVARGRELQVLVERHGIGRDALPHLVDVIRTHVPDLGLPALTASVLTALGAGWRLAVVTNGRPDIQARKVRALGLERFVDVVVLAAEHGSGAGKPEAAPFLAACQQLGVAPTRAVFVGDDPVCDIAGAHGVGMKTIWLPARVAPPATRPVDLADVIVASLADVPDAAAELLTPDWRAHVA